jgi:uncharacterized membrane protein YecN with MAPEG domain
MKQQPSLRERYRMLVSVLIIPLGLIIIVRASMAGLQAWTLVLLGVAFVMLGIIRLWTSIQGTQRSTMHKGKGK